MIDYIVTRVPVSELSTEPPQGIQMPYTNYINTKEPNEKVLQGSSLKDG